MKERRKFSEINMFRIRSEHVLVLLSFLTGIFLLLSIHYTPVIDEVLPPDPYFFIKNLSVFYWLSLASLLMLLIARLRISLTEKARRYLDIFIIGCLVLLVYGTPCFAYLNPVYVDTYIHTSASLQILLQGHTPPSLSMMIGSNDPGGYFFFAILMAVPSLDPLLFMRFYPLLISSILLFLLYLISSKLANSNFAILTPFIFTAAAYGSEFHVYPANLVYVFYALFLYFMVLSLKDDSRELKLLILLVSFSAIITYILSAFLLIPCILLLIILLSRMKKGEIVRAKRIFIILAVIVVIWISWLMYESQGSFFLILYSVKEAIMGPLSLKLPAATTITSVRTVAVLMELIITAFTVLAGILIAFLCFINKKLPKKETVLIIGGSFIYCCFAIIASLFLPEEAYLRFFSFSLIPYSLLVSIYFSVKRDLDGVKLRKLRPFVIYALLISMILFLLITPIVRDNNDPGYYYPSSSLKGADFTVEYVQGNVLWVSQHLQLIEYSAVTKGILLEGYMGDLQNNDVHYISLSSYLKPGALENGIWGPNEITFLSNFNKTAIKDFNVMIFNNYEDSLLTMSGYPIYSGIRMMYEHNISEVYNKVYSSSSLRIYCLS